MSFEYWFMLPISVLVATVAMASGVEGATFFAPIFMLGLGLPPEVAIGTGLITETFGFASGLYSFSRKKLIDYKLGVALLVVTIPMALLGSWLAGEVAPTVLKGVLGVGLLVVAASFLRSPASRDVALLDAAIDGEHAGGPAETELVAVDGEIIRYTVCNRTEGRLLAGVGSLFMGMISTGLGELNGYFLLQRCRVPSRVAVATSVFVVAITALTAAAGHLTRFFQSGPETMGTVLALAVFTVPGVIVGGQIGPLVASKVSQHALERAMGVLFIGVALLTLWDVIR